MQQEATAAVNFFALSLGGIAGHVRQSRHSPTSQVHLHLQKPHHSMSGSAFLKTKQMQSCSVQPGLYRT